MPKYGTCIIYSIDSLLQYYIKCAEGLHFSAFSVIQAVGSAGRGLYVEVLARCALPSEM